MFDALGTICLQATDTNSPLVLSEYEGNALIVGDSGAADTTLTVTLSVTDGTLTLSGTNNLSFTTGDGTNDSTMTFTGVAADINNALDGMIYTPASDASDDVTVSSVAGQIGVCLCELAKSPA